MSASADVLAQAKVEIALDTIPEGKNVCVEAPFLSSNMLRRCYAGYYQVAWQARPHPSPYCR